MSTSFYLTIALIAGLAVTLQGQFVGVMDRVLGTRESMFLTYGSGGLIATLLMFAGRGGNLKAWAQVPWYAYSAGALGLIIVGSIGITVSRLGTAKAFTLIVASQFLLAALIDHFGLLAAEVRPIDGSRAMGLGLMMVGVWLVVK